VTRYRLRGFVGLVVSTQTATCKVAKPQKLPPNGTSWNATRIALPSTPSFMDSRAVSGDRGGSFPEFVESPRAGFTHQRFKFTCARNTRKVEVSWSTGLGWLSLPILPQSHSPYPGPRDNLPLMIITL
jgi:hypothetical protein